MDEAAEKESKSLINGETESIHYMKSKRKGNRSKHFRCGSEYYFVDKCSLKPLSQIIQLKSVSRKEIVRIEGEKKTMT